MIKIEVTGNSIPEVADKLLAIGASLRASTPAAFQPTEPVNSITPTKIDPVMPELREVAKAAPVDPTPAPKSAPVAEVSESQPTTTEPSSTPAPAGSASEDEELEVVDLPIAAPEVNLRDLVLSVVEKRGKPVMEEILTRFGVAKASMVSPELLPELIGLCNEALAK
jgi:hypothetical protein